MTPTITVLCPNCRNRYQLDPSLRGKRMRCLNTICQTVFEVREESEREKGRGGDKETGRQGDKEKVESLSALDDLGFPVEEEVSSSSSVLTADKKAPAEVGAGAWEPPPVRISGRASGPVSMSPPLPLSPSIPEEASKRVHDKSRRRVALIVAMLVVLSGTLGGGLLLVSSKGAAQEEARLQKARAFYQRQDFEEANGAFQDLLRDFPSSKNRNQYELLRELSAVRQSVFTPREPEDERAGALRRMMEFLGVFRNDPALNEFHGDIWQTFQRLADELTRLAEQKHNPAYLAQAKRSWAEAGKFTPPAGVNVNEATAKLATGFERAGAALAARAARLELLTQLTDLVEEGSADAVRAGRALAKAAGLNGDDEVAALLGDLVRTHGAHIVFVPAALDAVPWPVAVPPRDQEDEARSIYITPRPSAAISAPAAGPESGVVLALARGVLYAFDADGNVLWVRRVGVDTTALPPRVPASAFSPEMVLVVSSDSRSVTAVAAATGEMIWRQTLEGVCMGQPVLVDRHVLVPTMSGQVVEIEATGGAVQGSYDLGQPLGLGGVRQPGTSLVYFPADSYCVYVLDVARRRCLAILYTGHAPGSLRGLPVIWDDDKALPGPQPALDHAKAVDDPAQALGRGGWMLLSVTSGADEVELRPYALPIKSADQEPADIVIKVRGQTSATPWHDGERLALATDVGLLALYGIRQKGNGDPLLFPLPPENYRFETEERAREARALVVHADAENYWVACGGKLQRLQSSFSAKSGPGLVPRWPRPLDIGGPLHVCQTQRRADGALVLFLVSGELDNPTCWIRAIDAEHGQILWQRQLGMVCQEQPVGNSGAVLCADAKGMFLFDAATALDKRWQPAGKLLTTSPDYSRHWAAARGTGFVVLSWGRAARLEVRVVDVANGDSVLAHPLPAPVFGTPALGRDFVLVPLANGDIYLVPLGEGRPVSGPAWRGVGADESQPGHIVALGNDDFAITDGGRTVMTLHWAETSAWNKQGEGVTLPGRVVFAPAVLGKQVLVADALGTVTVVEGARIRRQWPLAGRITAGPFARGSGAGVIVGGNHLVWLDPGKEKAAWEYTFVAPIVGLPELVDGLLVVADMQGGITGLDPATGEKAGEYRLKSNQAAAAAPIAFGPAQLFVPLMDGTAMVLPMSSLRE